MYASGSQPKLHIGITWEVLETKSNLMSHSRETRVIDVGHGLSSSPDSTSRHLGAAFKEGSQVRGRDSGQNQRP